MTNDAQRESLAYQRRRRVAFGIVVVVVVVAAVTWSIKIKIKMKSVAHIPHVGSWGGVRVSSTFIEWFGLFASHRPLLGASPLRRPASVIAGSSCEAEELHLQPPRVVKMESYITIRHFVS